MQDRSQSEAHVTRVDYREEAARLAIQRFNEAIGVLTREQTETRSKQSARLERGLRAMMSPFERIIDSDPTARAAHAKFLKNRLNALTPLDKPVFKKRSSGPLTIPLVGTTTVIVLSCSPFGKGLS